MKNMLRFAAAVLVASVIAIPASAQRGEADFTRFVAIGDSYGAGYESNGLNERHQAWSWPAVIARQVGYRLCTPTSAATEHCFAQPLVSYPGLQPELVLLDLTGNIGLAGGQGQALMTNFGRPYNNLAVPGANVADTLTATGAPAQGNPVATLVLRGLGTQVQQALVQNPTFIAIWIGGNDFLGAVTQGSPSRLTPLADFKTNYEKMLDTLIAGAPNAGIVVGNVPTNPLAVPYLTTVPRVLVNPATRQPVLGPDGQPIPLIADLGNGVIGPLPAGSLVVLPASAKIRTGFGIPEALRAIPQFAALPNLGRPLADTDVLTPTELTAVLTRVNEYNAVINAAATARNIPVADIKGLFDRVAVDPVTGAGGLQVGPLRITSAFVTGGFFSLDGVHLTDLGYMLFANEYIRTINDAWDVKIPVASITQLFANNGALFPETVNGQMVNDLETFSFDELTANAWGSLWKSKPARGRGRLVGH